MPKTKKSHLTWKIPFCIFLSTVSVLMGRGTMVCGLCSCHSQARDLRTLLNDSIIPSIVTGGKNNQHVGNEKFRQVSLSLDTEESKLLGPGFLTLVTTILIHLARSLGGKGLQYIQQEDQVKDRKRFGSECSTNATSRAILETEPDNIRMGG